MTLLEVRVQHLVVVSVAPWIQVPSSYVTTENETCDHQTCSQESNSTSLFCPFYFEKLHSILSPPSDSLSSGRRTGHPLLGCVTRRDLKRYYPDDDVEDSSSFLGASSHSSFPKGVDPGLVCNSPLLPDEILMCLCASRRNANMLRLIMNANTTRMNTVGGERLNPVSAVEADPVVGAPPLPTLSGFSEIVLS